MSNCLSMCHESKAKWWWHFGSFINWHGSHKQERAVYTVGITESPKGQSSSKKKKKLWKGEEEVSKLA